MKNLSIVKQRRFKKMQARREINHQELYISAFGMRVPKQEATMIRQTIIRVNFIEHSLFIKALTSIPRNPFKQPYQPSLSTFRQPLRVLPF